MKATVKLLEGSSFSATAGSGHSVTLDSSTDFGGRDRGMRPMEMLLLGLGGCTAIDVVHILRKGRQVVEDFEIQIEGDRAETIPKVFTEIRLHFVLRGTNLDPKKVERAISLSANKYCSASIMLGKSAKITHDFEILAD